MEDEENPPFADEGGDTTIDDNGGAGAPLNRGFSFANLGLSSASFHTARSSGGDASGPLSSRFSITNMSLRSSSSHFRRSTIRSSKRTSSNGSSGPLSRGMSLANVGLPTTSLHRATSTHAARSALGERPSMLQALKEEMKMDKRDFFAKENSFYNEGAMRRFSRRFSGISEGEGSVGIEELEDSQQQERERQKMSLSYANAQSAMGESLSNFFTEQAKAQMAGEDESVVKAKLSRAKAFHKAIRKSKYKKKAQGLVTSPATKTIRQYRKLKKYFKNHRHELRAPIFLCLWLCWLLTGTLFYGLAPRSNLGITRGFYMALNIGYSIGFGFPSEDTNSYLTFSTWYVLCGASFVGAALGFFAEKVSKDNEDWFSRLEQKKEIEDHLRDNKLVMRGRIKAWFFHYAPAIRALSVWSVFVVSMVSYSMIYIKWSIREALYFAISSLSTGGHWTIPNDSPDWLFGLTGGFIMFGVPMMAVAMAQIAYVFISNVDIDEAKATINAVVTKQEIEYLHELGMDEFDGTVDRAEFIILCMVRMGTDPGLIAYINQRFMELGFYTGEPLRVKEITQGAHLFFDGKIRRRASFGPREVQSFSEYEATLMSLREYDTDEISDPVVETQSSTRSINSTGSTTIGGKNRKPSILQRNRKKSFRRSVSFRDDSSSDELSSAPLGGMQSFGGSGRNRQKSFRRSVSFSDDSNDDSPPRFGAQPFGGGNPGRTRSFGRSVSFSDDSNDDSSPFRRGSGRRRSRNNSLRDSVSFHDDSSEDFSAFEVQPFGSRGGPLYSIPSVEEELEEESGSESSEVNESSKAQMNATTTTTKVDLVADECDSANMNMNTTKLDLVADPGDDANKQSITGKENDIEAPSANTPSITGKGKETQPPIVKSTDSSFLRGLLEKFRLTDSSYHSNDVTSSGCTFHEDEIEPMPDTSDKSMPDTSAKISLLVTNLQEECAPLGSRKAPSRNSNDPEMQRLDPPFVQSTNSNIAEDQFSLKEEKEDFPPPLHSLAVANHDGPTAKLTLETTVLSDCRASPSKFMGSKNAPHVHQTDLQNCAIYTETLRIQPPLPPLPPLPPPLPSIRDTRQDAKESEPTSEDHRQTFKPEISSPPKLTRLPPNTSSHLLSPAYPSHFEDHLPEHRKVRKKKNYARYLYSPAG